MKDRTGERPMVPLGHSFFDDIRERNRSYVDKSEPISDIIAGIREHRLDLTEGHVLLGAYASAPSVRR